MNKNVEIEEFRKRWYKIWHKICLIDESMLFDELLQLYY